MKKILKWLGKRISALPGPLVFLTQHTAEFIQHVYLTRIACIGLLVLLALPVLAWGPLRTLVLGAYDVGSFGAAVLIGMSLLITGGCLINQRKLVDLHGLTRFRADLAGMIPGMTGAWNCLIVLMVLLNSVTVLRASERALFGTLLGGLVVGIIVAQGLRVILAAAEKSLSGARNHLPVGFLVKRGLKESPGLIEAKDKSKAFSETNATLADGHLSAVVYGTTLVILFLLVSERTIHPLASILLLTCILTLLLSFATFLLDRHRVPLLAGVMCYCFLMTLWRESDHYYPVSPRSPSAPPLPTPAEIVGRATAQGRPLVIVTAAGGGIQSAAWTTRVLEQIESQMTKAGQPGFHESVRLISGVSGGSVGALQYAHAFDQKSEENRFDHAAQAAASSSLSNAVLGLVKRDLIRATMPYVVAMKNSLFDDRGRMLEQAWSHNAAQRHRDGCLTRASLQSWAEDARNLTRPALIMNATVVETGERMAISTVPRKPMSFLLRRAGNFEFSERYMADIPMLTAARLSATFPLVSPAARPALTNASGEGEIMPGPRGWGVFPFGGSLHHVVDGGYFENSGMVGALEWLDEALTDLTALGGNHKDFKLPQDVLILELSAFPAAAVDQRPVDAGEVSHGTLYDLISPGLTIANVRNSSQAAYARQLLAQFRQRWLLSTPRVNIRHVELRPAAPIEKKAVSGVTTESAGDGGVADLFFIKPNLTHAPLSWHLRHSEIAQIDEAAQRAVSEMLNTQEKAPVAAPVVETVADRAPQQAVATSPPAAAVPPPAAPAVQPAAPQQMRTALPQRSSNRELFKQFIRPNTDP